MADLKKLVVIDESLLSAMAANPAFTREFPFLKSLQAAAGKPRGGCGKCQKASQSRSVVFSSAKATIASLTGDRKRKLKELLKAERARVTYVNASKKTLELTF